MNKQSVLIFKLPELFKILNELKDHLDFNIFNFTEKQEFLNLRLKKKLNKHRSEQKNKEKLIININTHQEKENKENGKIGK